ANDASDAPTLPRSAFMLVLLSQCDAQCDRENPAWSECDRDFDRRVEEQTRRGVEAAIDLDQQH
ncbi:MAG TPA: hypothetical protein VF523_13910, partial [Burkholderiales bacterium]